MIEVCSHETIPISYMFAEKMMSKLRSRKMRLWVTIEKDYKGFVDVSNLHPWHLQVILCMWKSWPLCNNRVTSVSWLIFNFTIWLCDVWRPFECFVCEVNMSWTAIFLLFAMILNLDLRVKIFLGSVYVIWEFSNNLWNFLSSPGVIMMLSKLKVLEP